MNHPDLTPEMFQDCQIGSHMNILPTLIELIAPKDFAYYAIQPSLFEQIDYVVTPYCWMTKDALGSYSEHTEQSLFTSAEALPIHRDCERFKEEQEAWCELTGWTIRHIEQLRS